MRKAEGEMTWEIVVLIIALALGALLLVISSGMLGNSGIGSAILSPISELTAGAI